MLWNNVRFRTMDDEIVTNGLRVTSGEHLNGWQVRNIEVEMKPLDNTYTGNQIQEVSIDFDTKGTDRGFQFHHRNKPVYENYEGRGGIGRP